MENKDVVQKAIAAAIGKTAAAGQALPEAVREALQVQAKEAEETKETPQEPKRKEESYCNKECQKGIGALPKPTPQVDLVVKRNAPIWPMDEDQLKQWRFMKAMLPLMEETRKQDRNIPITPERLAEIRALAKETASRAYVTRFVPEKKPAVQKEPKAEKEEKSSNRQKRFGQTILIDQLIKEGKNDAEIYAAVREKIPGYPADKLPKLIKIRQYHVKKKE